MKTNPFLEFPVEKKAPLAARLVAGNISFVTTNIAAALAPLSLAMVCRQTTTFWASLFACLCLGEAIYPLEIVGMVLCYIAVVIIAMQRRDGERAESVETDGEVDPYDRQFLGVIISLFGGLILAIQSVSVRSIKTMKTEVIVFYYCLFGFSISALFIFAEMILTGNQTRLAKYTGR